MSKIQFRIGSAFLKSWAIFVCATAIVGSIHASTTQFWAINQFVTIQQINGDNGQVVQSFPVPFGSGNAGSIAVIGNVGYYTRLTDANIYMVDMTTHAYLGIAFNTGDLNYVNGITPDAKGHLWLAYGNTRALQEFTPAGVLVSTHAFPDAAVSYRDGSVVFGGIVVANRGDQTGPYDRYVLPGGNGALTYSDKPFINTAISGNQNSGNNGIAFNGVYFYVSNEQLHKVFKYDMYGNFVSVANLDQGSRYENWTFSTQDIISSCFFITDQSLDCIATNGIYAWHLCVNNFSTSSIRFLSITNLPVGVSMNSDLIQLPSDLDQYQVTCLTLLLTNLPSLTDLCFTIGAYDANTNLLCSFTNCLSFFTCVGDKTVNSGSTWSFDPPVPVNAGSGFDIVDLGAVTNGVSLCTTQFVTRTWQIFDCTSNSITCSQTVTVLPLVITNCPGNITVCLNSSGCGLMPDATSQVGAASSGGGTVHVSQDIPPGTILCNNTQVTFTVTDDCGNSNYCMALCSLMYCSNCPPVECPTNMVVDCTDDSGSDVDFPTVIGAVGTPSFSWPDELPFPIGTTPVTCVATNLCGTVSKCVFTVTVRGHGTTVGHWVRSNCGNTGLTIGNAIAVDQYGNFYIGGMFSGPTNFCGVPYSSIGQDGFLAKYDTLGNQLWFRQITGPGNDTVNGVAVDSQGNCYVVGTFDGVSVGFPDPAFQFYVQTPGAGGSDIFLAKYNPNGGVMWAATAGGAGADSGEGVAVDASDSCYITGEFSGTANFGGTALTSSSLDGFVAKWNPAGVFQWVAGSTGTSGHTVYAHSVAIDNVNGKAVITGSFSSDAQFGSTTPLGSSGQFSSAYVAQLNLADASWTWAKQVVCAPNCSSSSQDGRGIGVDNLGNCYFAAYFNGTASIGAPAPTVVNTYQFGLYDYLIGKFSSTGDPLGLVKGLIQGDAEPRGMAVDRDSGDVYITGFRHGLNSNVDGGQDAVLFKYDSNLNRQWTQSGLGTSANMSNTGRGVALDSAGCVYVTGSYTDNNFLFNNFLDGFHRLSARTTRLFVAKYCSSCSTGCVPATIITPLQNVLVTGPASPSHPINFTVTTSGSVPISYYWYHKNAYLPNPGGTGYTITISPNGLTSTLQLTGVPSVGSGSTYSVSVGNYCCDDCPMSSSHASIFTVGGGTGTNGIAPYSLRITADPGVPYTVEYRDNFNLGTTWQFLTNMIGTGTNPVIFDPNPNPVMRFYQIPLQPDE